MASEPLAALLTAGEEEMLPSAHIHSAPCHLSVNPRAVSGKISTLALEGSLSSAENLSGFARIVSDLDEFKEPMKGAAWRRRTPLHLARTHGKSAIVLPPSLMKTEYFYIEGVLVASGSQPCTFAAFFRNQDGQLLTSSHAEWLVSKGVARLRDEGTPQELLVLPGSEMGSILVGGGGHE